MSEDTLALRQMTALAQERGQDIADLKETTADLLAALERVLLNGIQHFKNLDGRCFLTCTGCPTEQQVRTATEKARAA